jgi:hypothetical protein
LKGKTIDAWRGRKILSSKTVLKFILY